jgi:EAL domain-containing protein (putative c-di-GMP-specific phosphodiesterase class I)
VVIELTERSPIVDYEGTNARLTELRALGCRLAIDDVGKGFSGLTHVVELSPDLLKFDRSLVSGVDADEHKSALIARLSSYADQVEMEVVAEGIETAGELETLRGLGVGAGQGFLLGRPGPIPSAADGSWGWPARRHPWAVRH